MGKVVNNDMTISSLNHALINQVLELSNCIDVW